MKRSVLLDTSYLLPKEMALKTVMSVVAQFKDGKKRTIQNLDAVPSLYSFTRKTSIKTDFKISKPETPSLYIANFNNDEGYVLISADMRAPEILGYSAGGKLDSTVHSGLKIALVDALQHVDEKVAEAETRRYDSTYNSMVKKLEDHFAKKYGKKLPLHNAKKPETTARTMDYGEGTCEYYFYAYPNVVQTGVRSQTGPLLQTEWTQNPPFNNQYPGSWCNQRGEYTNTRTRRITIFTNRHYIAGCIPIAESQILAYHASNFSSGSFGLSRQGWRDLTTTSPADYTAADIANVSGLVKRVYDSYGVFIIGRCDATGGGGLNADWFKVAPKGLQLWNSNASWKDYNEGDIKNSIRQGSPVLIGGCTKLTCPDIYFSWESAGIKFHWKIVCWGGGACHEWVLDGWRDIQTLTTHRGYSGTQGTKCHEWGWDTHGSSYNYTTTQITASFIHNNWGWGARFNADDESWFAPGVFGRVEIAGRNNYERAKHIVPFIR